MWHYIFRRLLQAIFLLLVLSFVSYVIMSLMPGDPVEMMQYSNPRIRPEDVERLKHLYGLDLPIYVRYWNWLKSVLFQFDLGYSRTYQIEVSRLVGERLLNTLYLSLGSIILALVVAIPLGIYTAIKVNSKLDYLLNLFAFAGISLPMFWVGIMSILIFSVCLGWLPAGGTQTIGLEASGWAYFVDRLRYLALPLLTFSLYEVAVYVRFTRGSMLEVLREDYIRTARAKGLTEKRVIFLHALRNALIPITTMVCLSLAYVFAGAIISEQVFAYQGVGKLLFDAIIGNDYNVAMVAFNIDIAMVLLFNLIADVAYGFLDPRISYA